MLQAFVKRLPLADRFEPRRTKLRMERFELKDTKSNTETAPPIRHARLTEKLLATWMQSMIEVALWMLHVLKTDMPDPIRETDRVLTEDPIAQKSNIEDLLPNWHLYRTLNELPICVQAVILNEEIDPKLTNPFTVKSDPDLTYCLMEIAEPIVNQSTTESFSPIRLAPDPRTDKLLPRLRKSNRLVASKFTCRPLTDNAELMET